MARQVLLDKWRGAREVHLSTVLDLDLSDVTVYRFGRLVITSVRLHDVGLVGTKELATEPPEALSDTEALPISAELLSLGLPTAFGKKNRRDGKGTPGVVSSSNRSSNREERHSRTRKDAQGGADSVTAASASADETGRADTPWLQGFEEQWGCHYYYNTLTHESTWEAPVEGFVPWEEAVESAPAADAGATAQESKAAQRIEHQAIAPRDGMAAGADEPTPKAWGHSGDWNLRRAKDAPTQVQSTHAMARLPVRVLTEEDILRTMGLGPDFESSRETRRQSPSAVIAPPPVEAERRLGTRVGALDAGISSPGIGSDTAGGVLRNIFFHPVGTAPQGGASPSPRPMQQRQVPPTALSEDQLLARLSLGTSPVTLPPMPPPPPAPPPPSPPPPPPVIMAVSIAPGSSPAGSITPTQPVRRMLTEEDILRSMGLLPGLEPMSSSPALEPSGSSMAEPPPGPPPAPSPTLPLNPSRPAIAQQQPVATSSPLGGFINRFQNPSLMTAATAQSADPREAAQERPLKQPPPLMPLSCVRTPPGMPVMQSPQVAAPPDSSTSARPPPPPPGFHPLPSPHSYPQHPHGPGRPHQLPGHQHHYAHDHPRGHPQHYLDIGHIYEPLPAQRSDPLLPGAAALRAPLPPPGFESLFPPQPPRIDMAMWPPPVGPFNGPTHNINAVPPQGFSLPPAAGLGSGMPYGPPDLPYNSYQHNSYGLPPGLGPPGYTPMRPPPLMPPLMPPGFATDGYGPPGLQDGLLPPPSHPHYTHHPHHLHGAGPHPVSAPDHAAHHNHLYEQQQHPQQLLVQNLRKEPLKQLPSPSPMSAGGYVSGLKQQQPRVAVSEATGGGGGSETLNRRAVTWTVEELERQLESMATARAEETGGEEDSAGESAVAAAVEPSVPSAHLHKQRSKAKQHLGAAEAAARRHTGSRYDAGSESNLDNSDNDAVFYDTFARKAAVKPGATAAAYAAVTGPVAQSSHQHHRSATVKPVVREDERGRRVMLDPSTAAHVRTMLPRYAAKYWMQRYSLFSRFDSCVQLDTEGWWSVTPEVLASHQAERTRQLAPKGLLAMDACCGCGGNVIQMTGMFPVVIGVEISPQRVDMARHNAGIYRVAHKCQFLCADFFQVAPGLKVDALFMSPPWGGPRYQHVNTFDVFFPLVGFNTSLLRLLDITLECVRGQDGVVAAFLPRNMDLAQLAEVVPEHAVWEVERAYVNNKLKGITLYCHPGATPDQPNVRLEAEAMHARAHTHAAGQTALEVEVAAW